MEIDDLESLSLTQLLIWRFRVDALIEEKRQQVLDQVCGRFLLNLMEVGIEPREAAAWLERRSSRSGAEDSDGSTHEASLDRRSK